MTEVFRQRLDQLTAVQEDRRVEVPERVEALSPAGVLDTCSTQGRLPDVVVEEVAVERPALAGPDEQLRCHRVARWIANRRLHARWAHFDERKKRPVVANTAIARELAG